MHKTLYNQINKSSEHMYTPIKIKAKNKNYNKNIPKKSLQIYDSNKTSHFLIKSNKMFLKSNEDFSLIKKSNNHKRDRGTIMDDINNFKSNRTQEKSYKERTKNNNSYLMIITNYKKNYSSSNFNFDGLKKSKSTNFQKKKNIFTYNFVKDTQKFNLFSNFFKNKNIHRKINLTSTFITSIFTFNKKSEEPANKNLKDFLIINNLKKNFKKKYINQRAKQIITNINSNQDKFNNNIISIHNKIKLFNLKKKNLLLRKNFMNNLSKYFFKLKKDTLKDNYDYPNFLSQNESKVRFSSSNQIANDIEKLSFFESFSSKKSQIIIK